MTHVKDLVSSKVTFIEVNTFDSEDGNNNIPFYFKYNQ